MDIAKVKEQVMSELNTKTEMSDRAIYNFVLKLVNNDSEMAKAWMTSNNGGGYTPGQVKYLTDKKAAKNYMRII